MSRPSKIVRFPQGRQTFPKVKVSEKEDFFFCAFYPASGFTDRGAKRLLSRTLFNSIINGNKSIVLKWLGAENNLEFAKPESEEETRTINSLLRRTFKIGEHFKGRVTSAENGTVFNQKSTGFRNTEGAPVAFQEQTVETRITVSTDSDYFMKTGSNTEIDYLKFRLFFVAPELAGNDVLYVENSTLVFDESEQRNHMQLELVSLGDRLRAAGRSLENLVTFGEPGANFFPFPDVYFAKKPAPADPDAPEPEESQSEVPAQELFYDFDEESVEYDKEKKKLYLQKNPTSYGHNRTQAVHSFQIEFDGAVFLNSIAFYGRPTPQDLTLESGEVIPSYELVSKIRPIWISKITQPEESINDSRYERKFWSITGKIQNQSWFESWKDEYGYFFDPNKQRTTQPILSAKVSGGFYEGREFFVSEDEQKKTTRINGLYNLATSAWSNFRLNAEIALGASAVTSTKTDWGDREMDLASFLNTQSIITHGTSFLEAGGVKTRNHKGAWIAGVDTATQSLGTVAAGIAGGVSGGVAAIAVTAATGLLKQATDTIFGWLPNSWFSRSDVYRPATEVDFLAPKTFLQDIVNKKPDMPGTVGRHRIPLELVNDQEGNYLSGFINGKNYKCGFAGQITHKFKLSDSDAGTRIDSIGFFDFNNKVNIRTQAVEGVIPLAENKTGYAIDSMIIKSLTKLPYKLTFFNSEGVPVWTTTKYTQAGYTGRLQEWETIDFFSDLKESGDVSSNQGYQFQPYPDRDIQAINDLNKTAIEQATARLKALNYVRMTAATRFIFKDFYEAVDTRESGSETVRIGLQALNTNFREVSAITFPQSIKDDLTTAHEVVSPTDQDCMKLLKDHYGFTKIETSTYNSVHGKLVARDLGIQTYYQSTDPDPRLNPIRSPESSFQFNDLTIQKSAVDIPDNTADIIDSSKRYYPYNTTTIAARQITVPMEYSELDYTAGFNDYYITKTVDYIINWGYGSDAEWALKYSFDNLGQLQISERNTDSDVGYINFRITTDPRQTINNKFWPRFQNLYYRNGIHKVELTKN